VSPHLAGRGAGGAAGAAQGASRPRRLPRTAVRTAAVAARTRARMRPERSGPHGRWRRELQTWRCSRARAYAPRRGRPRAHARRGARSHTDRHELGGSRSTTLSARTRTRAHTAVPRAPFLAGSPASGTRD
jgi:hypothetical protein